jgi:hypothetical protein
MTFLRPQTKKRVAIRYDQRREPNSNRGREQYRGKPSEKSHPGNGHADGHYKDKGNGKGQGRRNK